MNIKERLEEYKRNEMTGPKIIKLALEEYSDKLKGCWLGKNIGGTLGVPVECLRGVLDIDYYTQDLRGGPLPNDDLDLQLVWLNAAEKHKGAVNSMILGEYWHSYITANCGEYGAGKNNMRMGILPPLSGYVNNLYRDSNGAFIRSEIWACLAPGHPEIAVCYAYEDAIIDHSDEGVYAEIFCAAIESAAFCESDKYKLIEVGLSYIPEDCGVARGVKSAIAAFESGLTWQEARKRVLNDVPGSFGMLAGYLFNEPETDIPVGKMGWDAPSNIGIIIIAWLYGNDDFSESICMAVNCGEDTDCTAATIGSILGIIGGSRSIPEKWTDPLGNNIVTCCINISDRGCPIPKTIDELVNRIILLAPQFLGTRICDCITTDKGYVINMNTGKELQHQPVRVNYWKSRDFKKDILSRGPFVVNQDFVIFNASVNYCGEPYIRENEPKKIRISVENNLFTQQWIQIKFHVPDGWIISPSSNTAYSLEQYHCNIGQVDAEFEILPTGLVQERYDLIVEITSKGRHTKGLMPVVLINKGQVLPYDKYSDAAGR